MKANYLHALGGSTKMEVRRQPKLTTERADKI